MDKEVIKISSIKDIYSYYIFSDWKKRFIGEILELDYRVHKLEDMLSKTDEERGFEFNCPRHLLEAQLETMRALAHVYSIRAKLENIEIPEVEYE